MAAARAGRMGVDLTTGSIPKTLLKYAMPIILTNIVQQMYSLVDLMVIGHFLGSVGTVGVSTGGEMSDLVTPIAQSLATAGQIYIAQLAGARMEEKIRRSAGTLVSLMLLAAVLFMAIGMGFCIPILRLMNCPEDALSQAAVYMMITCCGFPFIFAYNAVCGITRGLGESKRPLEFVIVAATVNIFLDILFVAGFGWGVAGTAIATMASQVGAFAAAFRFLYKRREQFEFELRPSWFRLDAEAAKIILRLGIPQAGRATAVHFSMMWVNAGINAYGLVASATNGVGNKVQKFLNIWVISVTQAAGAVVGQNLGAGKQDRAEKTVWWTFITTFSAACVLTVISFLIPRQVFGIFTEDPAVLDFGVTFMHIIVLHYFASAFTASFQSIVTGAGFASMDFFIGILDGIVCRIGLSILFAYVLGMGAVGFFWAMGLTRVIPGIIVFVYFISGSWKKRRLLTEG